MSRIWDQGQGWGWKSFEMRDRWCVLNQGATHLCHTALKMRQVPTVRDCAPLDEWCKHPRVLRV